MPAISKGAVGPLAETENETLALVAWFALGGRGVDTVRPPRQCEVCSLLWRPVAMLSPAFAC